MITTTYRDIEIRYDEEKEMWKCEVAPKDFRKSQNLKSIRAAIDRFLDVSEKITKKFDKFKVWTKGYGYGYKDDWEELTVTSITDPETCWVTDMKGNRSKKSNSDCRYLYLDTPENRIIIEQIKVKQTERKNIESDIDSLTGKLKTLNLEKTLRGLVEEPIT